MLSKPANHRNLSNLKLRKFQKAKSLTQHHQNKIEQKTNQQPLLNYDI
jgi:hypothetical protein